MPFILSAFGWAALWLTDAFNTRSSTLCSVLYQCRFSATASAEWCQGMKADFIPPLPPGPQQHATLAMSFLAGSLTPTALLRLCMKPEGFIKAEVPETELESAVLSLQVCPCGTNTLFWCQSSIFKRVGSAAEGQVVKHRHCAAGKENILLLLVLLINTISRSESTKASSKLQNTNVAWNYCKTSHSARDVSRQSMEKVRIS